MSKKRMPFRGWRATALAAIGLVLAQLAAAGQPARVHFGYDQSDKDALYLKWDKGPYTSAVQGQGGPLYIAGHLYHCMGGACSSRINGHGPMNRPATEPLVDQTIRIQYKQKMPGNPKPVVRFEKVRTDDQGFFRVDIQPYPGGELSVTAAYYGQMDERGDPLVSDTKTIIPVVPPQSQKSSSSAEQ